MPTYPELVKRGEETVDRLGFKAFNTLDRIGNIIEAITQDLVAPAVSSITRHIKLMTAKSRTKSKLLNNVR